MCVLLSSACRSGMIFLECFQSLFCCLQLTPVGPAGRLGDEAVLSSNKQAGKFFVCKCLEMRWKTFIFEVVYGQQFVRGTHTQSSFQHGILFLSSLIILAESRCMKLRCEREGKRANGPQSSGRDHQALPGGSLCPSPPLKI